MSFLTETQWNDFTKNGYRIIDGVASANEITSLNARIDEIMSGTIQYPNLMMQLDPNAEGGKSTTSGGATGSGGVPLTDYHTSGTETVGQSAGFKGPSANYRKIGEAHGGLELDPLFQSYMCQPLFREICASVYGAHAGVSIYRAMVMAKPAGQDGGGTLLPWHQDGGDWWGLDRDPLCFIWLALTEATAANGAVEVIPGSHHLGLLSKRGHTLSDTDIERYCPETAVKTVTLKAGQAFLAHNWLIHRSGINTTTEPRRGFSANFVDSRTKVCEPRLPGAGLIGETGKAFPLLWERR